MPNGKPGDNPITDLLKHGIWRFPNDICDSIIEINVVDPYAFTQDHEVGTVNWDDSLAKYGDWIGWCREGQFDEARAFLKEKLALAKVIVNRRDSLADSVSSAVLSTFREQGVENADNSFWKTFTTYTVQWPDPDLAATRIHWDLFVRDLGSHGNHLFLSIETYPRPRVLLHSTQIAEFAPGDAAATVEFLNTQPGSA